MKRNCIIIFFAFFVLFGFYSCFEARDLETTYKGQVINIADKKPLENLEVSVTNGKDVYKTVRTDANGRFSVFVRLSEINVDYYILVGDTSCTPVQKELRGIGVPEIDLGIIEVDGPTLPAVKTIYALSAQPGKAVIRGEVTDEGHAHVFVRGVCYSRKEYPDTTDLYTMSGEGVGEFDCELTDLDLGVKYYVRAYAQNRIGISYGDPMFVEMADGKARVSTDTIYDIYANRAKCAGTVISDGGFKILERGVCWSTMHEPTIYDSYEKANADTGRFVCQLRNLDLSTPYFVRAYVKNETDITYGEERQFISADGLPVVTTDSFTTRATSITIGGTVKDNGGYAVLERGICYSATNMSPTENDITEKRGVGNGAFTVTINDLIPGETYYVRAYARNENDYGYGDPLQVTTGTGKPTVVMGQITCTATTASTTVKVTDLGGANLQSCGVCWSKTPNLSIQGNHVEASGLQLNTDYLCNISNLEPNTTYYVCAYATTNLEKTEYSDVAYFTTRKGEPDVANAIKETGGTDYLVISSSATTIVDAPITRQGVCWSTIPNPSISDNVVEANGNDSPFSCRVTELQQGTKYYCRAFAENRFGIGYSATDLEATTDYQSAKMRGHVYDQDGYPVAGVEVKANRLSSTTDQSGYYEIYTNISSGVQITITASKSEYSDDSKRIYIEPGQEVEVDLNVSLIKTCDVDLGNGQWADGPAKMIFECHQQSLAGKTTTRNMRLKNYRNVPVSWSLSNLPSQGLQVSKSSGTIPANSEISVTVTLTYPSTNAQLINLTGCASGTKAYVWNWEAAVGGVYMHDAGYGNYYIYQDPCAAACEQGVYIHIGSEDGSFHITFNQFVTYR